MLKKLALALALGVVLLVPTVARAASELDFTMVNGTGYGIKEVYVSPSAADHWGSNILPSTLENGQGLKVSFAPQAEGIEEWDLMIVWVDGGDKVYWRGVKLSEISKITLHYDRESGETSATAE